MPKLVYSSEKIGCGATIELDSGEVCMVSVAQTGVLVRSCRKGIFSLSLGATLYREEVVHKAAAAAIALTSLFTEYRVPVGFRNPVLGAFANAVWQYSSAAHVSTVLNSAVLTAEAQTQLPAQPKTQLEGGSLKVAINIQARNSIEGI